MSYGGFNPFLHGPLCGCCCCSVVGVILLLFGGLTAQSVSDEKATWTKTICSVAWGQVEGSPSCNFTVHTGLTDDRLWVLDFDMNRSGIYSHDIAVWGQRQECWALEQPADAAACDPAKPFNCTGDCFMSEDGTMVSDSRRSAPGKATFVILLIGLGICALSLASGCLFLALLGYICCTDARMRLPGPKALQCWSFVFLGAAAVLIGSGFSVFGSSQDGLWQKTTCSALIVQRGTTICSPEVQTGLTGDKSFTFEGTFLSNSREVMEQWQNDSGCAEGLAFKAWAISDDSPVCTDQLPLNCSGECWVNPELTEVADSGGGAFFTFALAVFLVFCGLVFATLASQCFVAFLARTRWPESEAKKPSDFGGRRVHAQVVGAPGSEELGAEPSDLLPAAGSPGAPPPSDSAAARRFGEKIGQLEVLLRKAMVVAGSMLTSMACLGCLFGAFVALALYMITERYDLDGNICLAGVALIGIFLLLLALGWVGLLLFRRRSQSFLQDLEAQCSGGDQDPQKILVGLAIRMIRTNRKCFEKMTELGVSAQELEKVLSKEPEEVPQALLELVGVVVICQLVVSLVQDQLRSIYETYIAQFGCCVVGLPGLITVSLLSSAFFTIEYEVDPFGAVATALTFPLYIMLYLQWVKMFMIPQCVLLAYLVIFTVVRWAQSGATVVSVLSWAAGIIFSVIFLIICYLYFRIVLPILEILVDVIMELVAIEVYNACGLNRDPEKLEELTREFKRRLRFCPRFLAELFN